MNINQLVKQISDKFNIDNKYKLREMKYVMKESILKARKIYGKEFADNYALFLADKVFRKYGAKGGLILADKIRAWREEEFNEWLKNFYRKKKKH